MFARTIATAAFAAALVMSSAAWAGSKNKLTDEDVAKLQIGSTMYSEIVEKYGKPMQTEMSSDGSRVLVYSVSRTRLKATTFVPVVGLFAGGAKADVTTQRLQFGPDGKLSNVVSSATHVDCGVWGGCSGSGVAPMGGAMSAAPAPAPAPASAPATAAPAPTPTPPTQPAATTTGAPN